ncbi:MAG TPA: FAD:protein FMN transferase [Polyangia bacterium]
MQANGFRVVTLAFAALAFGTTAVGGAGCGKSPDATTKAGAPVVDARPDGQLSASPRGPRPKRVFTLNHKCMGTLCEIKVFHNDFELVQTAINAGMAEMDRIEALMTSWTDTSDVAKVNAAAGVEAVKVDPDTLAVVKKGIWIGEKSRGAFDITVGVFKGLWRFDEDNDGSIPDPKEVRKRLKLVNYRDVIVDDAAGTVKLRRKGQRLNLEGLAKGYGVDKAVAAMRQAGINDFIFHAGGDLFASGRKGDREWRVGIQDPRAPRGKIIFDLALTNQAFNTSGDYERFVMKDGKRYHHILDARTGFPARGCRAVTLLADSAFLADVLDTAVFAAGPKLGMALVQETEGVQGVIIDADNKVHMSAGLLGKLSKRGNPTPGD